MEKIEYQREEYVRDIYCPICNAEIGVFRWGLIESIYTTCGCGLITPRRWEINRELIPR